MLPILWSADGVKNLLGSQGASYQARPFPVFQGVMPTAEIVGWDFHHRQEQKSSGPSNFASPGQNLDLQVPDGKTWWIGHFGIVVTVAGSTTATISPTLIPPNGVRMPFDYQRTLSPVAASATGMLVAMILPSTWTIGFLAAVGLGGSATATVYATVIEF